MIKHILITSILSTIITITHAQIGVNMELINHYNDTSLNKTGDQIWNDVMGWKDTVKNREYMIAGTTDSIYFFDISNPQQMIMCGRFWGTNSGCINRDYYPYSHYMYTVSDQCAGPGNMQIFDMQYLPDSVVKVYESDSLGGLTHSITIEPETKRLYMNINKVKNPNSGQLEIFAMDILSLENPVNPVRIGRLVYPPPYNNSRVHESYARNDTVYCNSENSGLFIWDIKDAANPVLLSAITPPYPQNAYNHSSWLDSTGRYILFCDETPAGVGMKIYDLIDIRNPRIVGQPFKEEGSPHNAYWMGQYAFASMYYGGVQVYDLSNVNTPKIAAYYDTYPQAYTEGYRGCWGVWPFLPSGLILASDMSNGLFVFKLGPNLGNSNHQINKQQLHVYPNPTNDAVSIKIPAQKNEDSELTIYNMQGKLVKTVPVKLSAGINEINLPLQLPPGLFLLKIATENVLYSTQLLKQ